MTSIATALCDLGSTGRAVAAMRQHSILPAVGAYETVLRPTATARALADFAATVGRIPEFLTRKDKS